MTDRDLVTPNFKNPKAAKKAKRQRQNWSKQCDDLAGKIVRSRGRCENCGSTERIQWAHGFSRRYRNVRWNMDNGFALCARDHWRFTHDPLAWDDWLRAKWGDDLYETLRSLALSGDRAHKPNTRELVKELAAQWDQIKLRIGESA